MSLSRSSSPVSSIYEDDLFRKLKLKHHRTNQSSIDTDDTLDVNTSDEWTSLSTTPELDVEPHFENYYTEQNANMVQMKYSQYLLTPDIDELQRKENELVQTLNTCHHQVRFKYKLRIDLFMFDFV